MAKLHFYYSTMNAGKSTTLLQSDYNYRERGMNTLLFTPSIDNRFGVGKISSRIGLQADALRYDQTTDLNQVVINVLQSIKLHCILIDEAQFLTKAQVLQLTDIVDELNIPVLAYGLRNDFQAEPFEGSKYLLTWADQLIEIKTICYCGKKATHVLRLDENGQVIKDGEQLQIGGNERYVSVCRWHFKQGKAE
ncbi:thymidine kinase [Caedibacter taeniospiralis]|uniref:thymidine kinase n=1 Tax=Caedibacter taeniospiralis TaxID=28907 RepID=UPI000C26E285|nr:thymidine kinase [Caedibacter taeniospiralis]